MKRIVLVALALLIASAPAMSQISFGGGVQGGLSIASFPDEIKDFYGVGFGGGAHLDVNVLRYLTLRLNGDFFTFPSDKKKVGALLAQQFSVNEGGTWVAADPAKTTVEGYNARAIGITLNGIGKIPTKSVVTPYALLGVGLHIVSASDMSVSYTGLGDITKDLVEGDIVSQPESKARFGLNFGAGSEFSLGGAKLYIEVRYVMIFTPDKKTNHIPITIGVTL
jgi:opacity protein-like surface antigen